jgi:hypothetical protein
MKRALLLSFVFVPVLLGMRAAGRGPRRGLVRLLAALVVADVLYAVFLYYLYLRLT